MLESNDAVTNDDDGGGESQEGKKVGGSVFGDHFSDLDDSLSESDMSSNYIEDGSRMVSHEETKPNMKTMNCSSAVVTFCLKPAMMDLRRSFRMVCLEKIILNN